MWPYGPQPASLDLALDATPIVDVVVVNNKDIVAVIDWKTLVADLTTKSCERRLMTDWIFDRANGHFAPGTAARHVSCLWMDKSKFVDAVAQLGRKLKKWEYGLGIERHRI